MDNKHLEAIPTDIIAQVQTKLNEIRPLLLPYATPLTPSERRDLLKMGEKSLTFVEKSYRFALENHAVVWRGFYQRPRLVARAQRRPSGV